MDFLDAVQPYLGSPAPFVLLIVAFVRLEMYLGYQRRADSTLAELVTKIGVIGGEVDKLKANVDNLIREVRDDFNEHRKRTHDELEEVKERLAQLEVEVLKLKK